MKSETPGMSFTDIGRKLGEMSVPLLSSHAAYKTVTARYKTVMARYKTVTAIYKTATAIYETVMAIYERVKNFKGVSSSLGQVECLESNARDAALDWRGYFARFQAHDQP